MADYQKFPFCYTALPNATKYTFKHIINYDSSNLIMRFNRPKQNMIPKYFRED